MIEKRKPVFLVIDDEEEIRDFFQCLAEDYEWKLVSAQDGIEAKKIIKEIDFSIIFIDIILVDVNGLDLLKELKRICSKNTLFVVMTGKATIEEVHKSYTDAGAYTCIMKPFELKRLLNLINMMLSIDPVKLKKDSKIRDKKSYKILTYFFILLVTFVAAMVFIYLFLYT